MTRNIRVAQLFEHPELPHKLFGKLNSGIVDDAIVGLGRERRRSRRHARSSGLAVATRASPTTLRE